MSDLANAQKYVRRLPVTTAVHITPENIEEVQKIFNLTVVTQGNGPRKLYFPWQSVSDGSYYGRIGDWIVNNTDTYDQTRSLVFWSDKDFQQRFVSINQEPDKIIKDLVTDKPSFVSVQYD